MFTAIFGSVGTWAVAALAVIALMVLSFIKGMAYEGERRLAEEVAREEARKEVVRTIEKEVEVVRVKYVPQKKQIEKDHDIAIIEVIEHAKTLPDSPECWFAPERLSTVATGWGIRPVTDSGKRPDSVQTTGGNTPAEERKPR